MRIHSDILEKQDILAAVNHKNDSRIPESACAWEVTRRGSRSRDHAYEVRLGADAGKDIHNKTRRPPARVHPSADNFTEKALTYAEWGFFIANLFALDPNAKIGEYDGEEDFQQKTSRHGSTQLNGYEPYAPSDFFYYEGDARRNGEDPQYA